MGRAPGARELELKAQRERQAKARERVTNRPTVAPMLSVGSGVERRAELASKRRLSEKEIDEIVSLPNIRDEQMAVTDSLKDSPLCLRCDLPMDRNPVPRNAKKFSRVWLCPVCDQLPGERPVTAAAESVEEETEMAKRENKSAKKAKAKKVTAKVVKKAKMAVAKKIKDKAAVEHVNGGSKRGRPRGGVEAMAYWDKIGISRRTYYRYKLEGKLTDDGSKLLK